MSSASYTPRHLHPEYFAREYGPRRRAIPYSLSKRGRQLVILSVAAFVSIGLASLPASHAAQSLNTVSSK